MGLRGEARLYSDRIVPQHTGLPRCGDIEPAEDDSRNGRAYCRMMLCVLTFDLVCSVRHVWIVVIRFWKETTRTSVTLGERGTGNNDGIIRKLRMFGRVLGSPMHNIAERLRVGAAWNLCRAIGVRHGMDIILMAHRLGGGKGGICLVCGFIVLSDRRTDTSAKN